MMKKSEVELIILTVKYGHETILDMKIYKDGTLCRRGCGGIPEVGFSGMTMEGDFDYFEKIMEKIDEQILQKPINYQEENIKAPLEYVLAFFGASSNGETGERAQWTKSTGVRFMLDNDTAFRHPLLGLLDGLSIQAAEMTNEWYFDVIMAAVYNLVPENFEQTFVTAPKTPEQVQEHLSRYVSQIGNNAARGWDIVKIGNNRKYRTRDGKDLTSRVEVNNGSVSINFSEKIDINNAERMDEIMKMMSGESEQKAAPKTAPSTPLSKTQKEQGSKKWWEIWK